MTFNIKLCLYRLVYFLDCKYILIIIYNLSQILEFVTGKRSVGINDSNTFSIPQEQTE